jgi:hypothetical protein
MCFVIRYSYLHWSYVYCGIITNLCSSAPEQRIPRARDFAAASALASLMSRASVLTSCRASRKGVIDEMPAAASVLCFDPVESGEAG